MNFGNDGISGCGFSIYMLKDNLFSSLIMVMSSKLIVFSCSSFRVNFILGSKLLNMSRMSLIVDWKLRIWC